MPRSAKAEFAIYGDTNGRDKTQAFAVGANVFDRGIPYDGAIADKTGPRRYAMRERSAIVRHGDPQPGPDLRSRR